MGLDMYLYAQKFTSPMHNKEVYNSIISALDADGLAMDSGHAITEIEVAYWRKANAIHNWFVGDREDDCKPIQVDRQQLVELLSICSQLLAAAGDVDANADALAEELLPPVAGFFFGSTEIDEWYWHAVEDTIKQLEHVLDNTDGSWAFEYCASW